MSQKNLSAVVIIVVIGTVMAAGIYFFVAKRDYSAFASNQGDGAARTNESPPGNGWKVFRDSRYGFQFAYPAGWSVGSYHDRNIILLKDERNYEIITINSRINLALIGVSYCGAYPEDKRCEVLKTDGGCLTIDWGIDGEASAIIGYQDGIYGAGFTLYKITSEMKEIFRKILLSFKSIS